MQHNFGVRRKKEGGELRRCFGGTVAEQKFQKVYENHVGSVSPWRLRWEDGFGRDVGKEEEEGKGEGEGNRSRRRAEKEVVGKRR